MARRKQQRNRSNQTFHKTIDGIKFFVEPGMIKYGLVIQIKGVADQLRFIRDNEAELTPQFTALPAGRSDTQARQQRSRGRKVSSNNARPASYWDPTHPDFKERMRAVKRELDRDCEIARRQAKEARDRYMDKYSDTVPYWGDNSGGVNNPTDGMGQQSQNSDTGGYSDSQRAAVARYITCEVLDDE